MLQNMAVSPTQRVLGYLCRPSLARQRQRKTSKTGMEKSLLAQPPSPKAFRHDYRRRWLCVGLDARLDALGRAEHVRGHVFGGGVRQHC